MVHDRAIWQHLWLVPHQRLIAFAVWFASFADHTVHWRGEVFILENGKIRPAHPHKPEMVSASKPDRDKVSVHS